MDERQTDPDDVGGVAFDLVDEPPAESIERERPSDVDWFTAVNTSCQVIFGRGAEVHCGASRFGDGVGDDSARQWVYRERELGGVGYSTLCYRSVLTDSGLPSQGIVLERGRFRAAELVEAYLSTRRRQGRLGS